MEKAISKAQSEELKNKEIRGSAITSVIAFIRDNKGEDAVRRLEEEMVKLGYQIKLKKIKEIQLYPLQLVIVLLITAKRLFNFNDKDFQEMGMRSVKVSIVVRSLIQFLTPFSFKQVVSRIPEIWKRINPIGRQRVVNFDEGEKFAILRLEDYRTHPIQCQILTGAFAGLFQIMGGKKTTCKETKCIYAGDDYHEFLLKW